MMQRCNISSFMRERRIQRKERRENLRIRNNASLTDLNSSSFFSAVSKGRINEVQAMLIEKKVDINEQDRKSGKTALHIVIKKLITYSRPHASKYQKIFLLLCQHKANPMLQDNKGLAPIHLAHISRKNSLQSFLLSYLLNTPKERTCDASPNISNRCSK